jgi:hypothetical protein
VLIGSLVGSVAIKAGGLVVVLLALTAVILILVADRRRLIREDDANVRLVAKYCDLLKTRFDTLWYVTKWDQQVTIEESGDTKQVMTIHAIADCEYLDFFRLKVGAGWNQPEKYRRRVKVSVRSVDIAGKGGPQCEITAEWTSDNKREVVVHLPSPVTKGNEFRVVMEWDWPGKCRPLMCDARPEEFCINFTRITQLLKYTIEVPKGVEMYCHAIGSESSSENYKLRTIKTKRAIKYQLEARDVPSARKVGLRLQRKK